MQLLLVGIGGILGSLGRFWIGKLISERASSVFPLGTFLINISGALLLGALTGTGLQGKPYAFFGDGFLGAFTTFSTFMYEGFDLFQGKKKLNAAVYISATIILGIIGYFSGFVIFKALWGT